MSGGSDDQQAGALGSFRALRPRLFGIAYRMLGSATDAEDLLQDAWLRWQGVDHGAVADPTAFLVRLVTNLCLNELDSARARREVYVGSWLPEPVLTGAGSELGPLDDAVQRETVSFALLTMLERLSPAERAAYVLREAFAYSSREVGELLGTSEANARQLHSRARRHLGADRVAPVDPARWQELVASFFAAARDGDVARLEALLADDVEARADGGGRVSAARRPVHGREKVARYLLGVLQRFADGLTPAFMEVNGETALVATGADGLRAVWFLETDGAVITGLKMVVNPAKLEFAAGQLSRIGAPSGPWYVMTNRTTLVTGATGTLGVPTTARLRAAGHDVRALSRRAGPGLVTGDLLSGVGLAAAMDGVGTVVHLATGKDDVRAARSLLDAARQARVEHLVLISIVGIDEIPLGYYEGKVAVERLVSDSGLPHTILRATQFHSFVERLFTAQRWSPAVVAPAFELQPIAVEEVAGRLVELAAAAPAGRVPDIGGPVRSTGPELAAAWAGARGVRRPIVPLRLPGRTFSAYRAGHQLAAGSPFGTVRFEQHLASGARVSR